MRKIPTGTITLTGQLEHATTPDGISIRDTISIDINVSLYFPGKRDNALVKVADQFVVKKTLPHPQKFAIKTVVHQ
jgi:hypothetical protein